MKMRSSSDSTVLRNNIVASFAIKGCALVVAFLSTPAYIRFFEDNSSLGIWFAVVAALNWVLFFDFGLGNGLRNNLVKSLISKDYQQSRELISSAYCALGFISIGLLFAYLVISCFIQWDVILGSNHSLLSPTAFHLSISIVVVGTLVQLWLRLITSVMFAFEKTAIPSLVALISNAAILFAIMLPIELDIDEKLLYVSWVQVLSMNAPLLIMSYRMFCVSHPELRPTVKAVTRRSAKLVCGLGGKFFFVQLMLMAISSTNEFLITAMCSPAYVVDYSVYYRLFNLAVTLFSLAVQPLWSSMGKAFEEGRLAWIKRIHSRFVISAIATSLLCFSVIPLLPIVFQVWLGNKASVSAVPSYAIAFAGLSSSMVLLNASTCVANAMGKLKTQLLGLGVGALIKIPLSIMLVSFGWIGIVWANVICILPTAIIQTIVSRSQITQCFRKERGDKVDESIAPKH